MRRAAIPLLAFLLLATAAPATLGAAPASQGVAAGWRETLTINTALAHPAKMFEAFDTASLNLYDFNGDGQLEIVSNNDNNRAYVLDSRTGAVLAELATPHPAGEQWPVRELNPIAIGNLYGDGVPCLVIPSSASYLTTFCYNAANSTATHFDFVKKWSIRVDARLYEPDFNQTHPYLFNPNGTTKDGFSVGLDGDAFLADSDGDGCMEIFVETDGWPGQFSFNCDGSYRWSHSWYDGNAGAQVLDVNKDGRKDACFATDSGDMPCYDAKTGGVEWTFRAREHGAYPGSVPVAPVFADVYGNGQQYLFFGARNARYNATSVDPPKATSPGYDANWMNETHAVWYLVDPKGNMVWNASYDWMNPVQYNHPAAIDVNGDGVLDFVALDWNTIGHKPGDWEPTNRSSNLFALDGRDGSVIWRTPVPIYWSNKDFVIADADGDGKMDIVAPTPKLAYDGLGVFDLATGKEKGWMPFADHWGLTRGPVAGDLYGDGHLYLVVPAARKITDQPNYRSLDVGYREGELHVVDTGQAWNVKFSANFLLTDTKLETQHGTVGGPVATKPGAPGNVAATAQGTNVALTWAAPSSTGNAAITAYRVLRDGAQVGEVNALAWTDANVAPGAHTYTVRAVNSAGESADSAPASVTVASPTTTTTPPPASTTPPTATTTSTPPAVSSTTPTSANVTTTTPVGNGSNESTTTTPSRVPFLAAPLVAAFVAAAALALRRRR